LPRCVGDPRPRGLIACGQDDLLISTALYTILDQQDWLGTGFAAIPTRIDPLTEIDQTAW
jgi:hypothetical protein